MCDGLDLDAITSRLLKLQEESNFTAKVFCEETGIPASTFSQIKNGTSKINVEIINKVISRWKKLINPMWFLFGDELACLGKENYGVNPELFIEKEEIVLQKKENSKAREVERIVLFYSDGTFQSYTPSID